MELVLEPLAPRRLDEFAALLGGGEFGGCFCAVWTSFGDDWAARCADPARPNLAATARDLAAGRRVGYFVRDGGEVVAWTGSGPKTEFPLLATKLGSRLTPSVATTWSVGCLAVREAHRGRRLGAAIVEAVVDEARRAGAACVEAYPVRPFHEPRVYRGTVGVYERAGFAEAGAEKDGEHEIVLMRRAL
jgi:GNAT superfamily N-acetyltransferase